MKGDQIGLVRAARARRASRARHVVARAAAGRELHGNNVSVRGAWLWLSVERPNIYNCVVALHVVY